jgi:hypothetical protein
VSRPAVHGILTKASVELVGAFLAKQEILTIATHQNIVSRAADQQVISVHPQQNIIATQPEDAVGTIGAREMIVPGCSGLDHRPDGTIVDR